MKQQYLIVCLVALGFASFVSSRTFTDSSSDERNTAEELAFMMMNQDINNAKIPAVAARLGLTELVKAVTEASLADTLNGAGPFTVFGPSNQAFRQMPSWVKEFIGRNKTRLAFLLTYHVLSGRVSSSQLKDDLQLTTVNGAKLRVNLYPKGQDKFSVATAQCQPIDLSRVDEMASNGILHVVNKIMIPPSGPIADSIGVYKFKTLKAALEAAGLSSVLNGDRYYTLFAPTEDAFKKLPPGVLDNLLKNKEALAEVLKYHVVPGTYCSAGLRSGRLPTLASQDVNIAVSDAGLTVNDAKVTILDGSTTNGVIHAIDRVLIPRGL